MIEIKKKEAGKEMTVYNCPNVSDKKNTFVLRDVTPQ